jgi:hypothetical protein
MNTKTIATLAGATLLPLVAFAQTPPAPPAPPAAPAPPAQPAIPGMHDHDRGPKVPVTWLGVETSEVPRVVSEQLGLARGFGLVVDYVVPEGPAAAAGVQQNDIIKMLNDQILTEPGQLSKLIRSYSDGTTVTLTVLRKGAEQKLTVKLAKHDVSGHFGMTDHDGAPGAFGMNGKDFNFDFSDMGKQMEKMREKLAEQRGPIREAVARAREEAARAGREARRQAREMRLLSRDNGAMRSTRIDMGKAQIVYSDQQGEMRLDNLNGKKVLTAKDPQGKLLFSGPVETKEEIDKLPPEVRQRFDKLENKDLPAVGSNSTMSFSTDSDDNDSDADDDDDNDSDDDDNGSGTMHTSLEQVSTQQFQRQTLPSQYVRL